MTISDRRSTLWEVALVLVGNAPHSYKPQQKRYNINRLDQPNINPEAPWSLQQIWGCVRFLTFYMAANPLSFMFEALSNLEKTVEAAATSMKAAKVQDKAVLNRISSYKEIIRRQHSLLADLKRASAREDWKEVSRITNLVHGASLMIKVDAGFLISNIRAQRASPGSASH
jgi:hypothetical protein